MSKSHKITLAITVLAVFFISAGMLLINPFPSANVVTCGTSSPDSIDVTIPGAATPAPSPTTTPEAAPSGTATPRGGTGSGKQSGGTNTTPSQPSSSASPVSWHWAPLLAHAACTTPAPSPSVATAPTATKTSSTGTPTATNKPTASLQPVVQSPAVAQPSPTNTASPKTSTNGAVNPPPHPSPSLSPSESPTVQSQTISSTSATTTGTNCNLPATLTITVTLTIGTQSYPLPGVILTNLTADYPNQKTTTKDNGIAPWQDARPCSTVQFQVEKTGLKTTTSQTKNLTPGDNTLTIELSSDDCLSDAAMAKLTGQVTLTSGGQRWPAAGAGVFVTLLSGAPPNVKADSEGIIAQTTADGQGHYHFDSLPPCVQVSVTASLVFAGDSTIVASDSPTLTLLPGSAYIANLNMNYNGPDLLQGQVTDQNGHAVEGITVSASNGDPALAVSDTTDSSGHYRINLAAGTYKITAARNATSLQTAPSAISVTFTQPRGQIITKNFSVKITGTFTVEVIVRNDDDTSPANFPEDISDAHVVLSKGNHASTPGIKSDERPDIPYEAVYIYDVPDGTYTASASRPPYINESVTFTVAGSDKTIVIELHKPPVQCLLVPQANVKAFWFCGNEAIRLAKDSQYASKWAAIDGWVPALRAKTGVSTLPEQIVIVDSGALNAAYFPVSGCPPLKDDPEQERGPENTERIEFTTTYMEAQISSLQHTLTHEGGHGADWHKGNCVSWRSDEPDFAGLRKQAGIDGIDLLTDGLYDTVNPYAGHPNDNPTETYASAFHAGWLHSAAFEEKISNQPESVKQALEQIVAITQQPL